MRDPNAGDYPRSCGGTSDSLASSRTISGLSPLVRGNPIARASNMIGTGTIPARAGEPMKGRSLRLRNGDYPRSCGGTFRRLAAGGPKTGLSPLVRGNQTALLAATGHHGTIPARAGEPRSPAHGQAHEGDYPRSCGGTLWPVVLVAGWAGLSPLVRGNLLKGGYKHERGGTIPARAGEPSSTRRGP